MTNFFPLLILVFLCPLCWPQAILTQVDGTPPCTVTEDSIFKEARTCGKSREGSLSKSDLTVAGFAIGESTLEDVARRFPGSRRFRLTKDEEASVGLCVKDERGTAIVFASGTSGGWSFLDSIFIAKATMFERQGAKCNEVGSLPTGVSTKSGIRLGIEKERLLALLHIPRSKGASFAVDYETSPDKAPWVSEKDRPSGKGWVAMSGAYGEFREGRLRWVVLYAGLSN